MASLTMFYLMFPLLDFEDLRPVNRLKKVKNSYQKNRHSSGPNGKPPKVPGLRPNKRSGDFLSCPYVVSRFFSPSYVLFRSCHV